MGRKRILVNIMTHGFLKNALFFYKATKHAFYDNPIKRIMIPVSGANWLNCINLKKNVAITDWNIVCPKSLLFYFGYVLTFLYYE